MVRMSGATLSMERPATLDFCKTSKISGAILQHEEKLCKKFLYLPFATSKYMDAISMSLLWYSALSSLRIAMPKLTAKGRKGKGKLVYFQAPHVPEDKTVKHRYTLFSSNAAGYLTRKTSTLNTTITWSPELGGNVIDIVETPVASHDVQANIDIANDDSNVDPLFDAAYVRHLEDTGNDNKIKRNRAKGVCPLSLSK